MKKTWKCILWHVLFVFQSLQHLKNLTEQLQYDIFNMILCDNVHRYFQKFVMLHGIPRTIRFQQGGCQIGKQNITFSNKHNINLYDFTIMERLA